jgi:hypothetical protein
MIKSSYITYGDSENLSVCYSDLYLINDKICYISGTHQELPESNKWTDRYRWKPDIINFIDDKIDTKSIELAVFGDSLWAGNIGHGLFDCLYPLYVALVKFQYFNEDFTLITYKFDADKVNDRSYEPFNTFCGNKILELFDHRGIVRIKKLVVGTGKTGNRVINPEYTLYGQKEYNALALFKKRMLIRHECKSDKNINTRINAIFIKNKRYSDYEDGVIKKVILYYKNSDNIELKYIDWYRDYKTFKEQIKDYQDVDLQITGPGTGMMYTPFLKKGAVNINLGYIEHIQTNSARPNIRIPNINNDNIIIPGWMEQSVCAGASYVNTIYYDRFMYNNLEYDPMLKIINDGISKIGSEQSNNWNMDALIFKEYCKRCSNPQKICEYLTDIAFFIELFVNEHPAVLTNTNIELLREIKTNFGYPQKYNINEHQDILR